MSKVLIVGATGWLGSNVMEAFQGTPHQLTAFVRPESLENSEKAATFNKLKERGVQLFPGELNSKENLVAALQGMDVCICCLGSFQTTEQFPLVEALKEVGTIKRFIPCDFGMDYRRDPHDFAMTEDGLKVHQAIFDANIPYTIIDNGAFMEVALGKLCDWSQREPITLKTTTITRWGEGNVTILTNAVKDIARYVVRTIDDPNTINKRVMIDGHSTTQNQLFDLWEEVSGTKLQRKQVDLDELQEMIKKVDGYPKFALQLARCGFFRNGFVRSDDYLSASELYPDIYKSSITIKQFLEKRLNSLK
ncbi:hypothetical protein INT44_007446 [Umbelopsis vinacea]|uniref:NmrA-like domain-containing protein n=1 Tax=Umbelopsis vinacea TaxID=44442 RepID=A0A8H7UCR7_9FUNG|nr:hypothetical protein INT44_007446 [Umbelopsis vinacea]